MGHEGRTGAPGAPASIRSADRNDLEGVTSIWIAITEHHRQLDPCFALRSDARPEARSLCAALLRDPDVGVFVAEGERGLEGLCMVRIDRAPPILEETLRAEITDLGVEPTARRRGLGTRLAERALAWARERGAHRIEVRVARGNREGQAFWRARGFGDLMDVLQKRM